MLKKILLPLIILLVTAVIIFIAFGSKGNKKNNYIKSELTQTQKELPEVGCSAPGFTLKDIKSDEQVLSNYKGKAVLLNFWASWCGPCRSEMPSMDSLYQRMKDRNFEILAVSVDQRDTKRVLDFVSKYKLTFPVLLNPEGNVAIQYRVTALPTSFVIDKKGVIRAKVVGARNWSDPSLVSQIENLL
jgi:cytochrome c biogenesis protein CcmG/thiol:disulfide interchange protein DsbE